MPAKFHQVTPTVWDRTMRELSGPAKVVRLYVMTCPNRVTEGLFQLPLGIIVHDTGLTEQHVRDGLDACRKVGVLDYDEDAEVILDRTALKFAPLKNGSKVDKDTGETKVWPDNRIPGAVRMFDNVPDTTLKVEFYGLARQHSPDLADELLKDHPDLEEAADPWSPPHEEEAPSKPLHRSSQAPSRDETEASTSRDGGGAAPVLDEDDTPPCSWCGESSLVQAGVVQVGPGDRPWCTFCDAEGAA